MKAIIEKGKADNNIQSCFISVADKFAKSLDPSHI